MTRRISSLGLALSFIGDKTVTVTGAKANANANAVGTSTLTFGRVTQLGPLVLPGRIRNISAQQAGVSIVLVGSAGQAQGEELEGADATIYIDGARTRARAGDVIWYQDLGSLIVNANATTDVPSNYEIDPISGFRQYPIFDPLSKMRRRWDGEWTRAASLDERHAQEFVKSRGGDSQRGGVSPEQDDSFISTSVSPEDL